MQKTAKEAKDPTPITYQTDGKWQFYLNMRKWSKDHEIYENIFKLKAKKRRLSTENRCC